MNRTHIFTMKRWTGLLGVLMVGAVVFAGARGALAQAQPSGGHGAGMGMDPAAHYIEWMIPHHEDAVAIANVALTQAEHPELRALAVNIRQTQTDEIGRMRHWYQASDGAGVPADSMAAGMMRMTGMDDAPLAGASPFDKAFIEQMIPHHEMAVMGSTMALRMIERPELRELLQSIITSQSAEVAQMRDWYHQWYGVPVPQSSAMGGHGTMGNMSGHPMMGSMGSAAGQQMDHAQMMGGRGGHTMMGSVSGAAGHQLDGHRMGESIGSTERQQMIHERGASVMPFDLNQTTHRFQVLPDGGLQTVAANDPTNQTQITLIQQHLAQEAQRFQRGDFSDPASLHGAGMPGLAELAASATRLEVVYVPLADGAQIRYTSRDPGTIAALHRWFDAQLTDHGPDAISH